MLSAFGRSRPWTGVQTPWTGVLGLWTGVQRLWTGVQRPWRGVQGPQAAQRAFLGAHKGVARATKATQRAPRGGQRARPRDLGTGKMDPKSASEAKKVKFAERAPRLGPADVPGTPPPSRLTPNRPKMVPSRSLGPLERAKLHLAQANLALYGPLWPNLASKSPVITAQQSISEHLHSLGFPQSPGARGLLAEH